MPELPEVETIRRISDVFLVGHTVVDFDVSLPKLFRQSIIQDPRTVEGRRLLSAARRAKVLNLGFAGDLNLLIHFKLAGQWAVFLQDGSRHVAGHPVPRPDGEYPHKSTHATIRFDDGRYVLYSDIRQFGWFNLLPSEAVEDALAALELGPEATVPIDAERLADILARRTVPVKAVLLDQRVLAGLGNIYVDESLFAAGVHPQRPGKSLSRPEIDQVIKAIPVVLAEGIRQGGVTIVHGKAEPKNGIPAVHGREGETCIRCGDTIVKTRVAGRGTYFCPTCQPVP